MSMDIRHWAEAVQHCQRQHRPFAIVTVLATAGSTPRANGTKMVVDADHSYDSIGGGQLEFLAIQRARELLLKPRPCQEIKQFPLAAQAQQCCGGSVTLIFESFTGAEATIALFGAGHVAQALAKILSDLPYRVIWADSRPELLHAGFESPNLEKRLSDDVCTLIPELPDQSMPLILTHDHQLDYRLVCHCLKDYRWRYLGLIGSKTKAKRFQTRLRRDGFDPSEIDRLICPVGMDRIPGKRPMEVAVSIAAALIAEINPQSGNENNALSWRDMKAMLNTPSETKPPQMESAQ